MRFVRRLVLLGLLVPGTGTAQTAEQRAALERFRDSLALAADSSPLAAREQRLIATARQHRDSTLLHLQLGFIAHRLGEITGVSRHYDDAASEFEWAAELEPEWPYPWYGVGLAELALGEHKIIALENVKQALGLDFLSKAARAFGHAARVDPAFAQAVIDLAHTAMRQRVNARLDVARDALREAAATAAGQNPALQLARGRVEREVGEGDSAVTVFQRYLAVGGDSGVGTLELARSRFYLRRSPEAIAAYFDAADRAQSAEARALFRGDIAWIAAPGELAAFDSLPSGGYRAWLEQFWSRRDADDGRRRGERIVEHYRRYFYALRHYHLVSRHRHYDITERYRSEQNELDDRGIIYLRHGEPDRRATYSSASVEPNESWQYAGPGGQTLVFHFVARDDVADYKLVESLADAYGARIAITAAATGNASLTAGLFESRSQMDPVYQRLGGPGTYSNRGSALAQERERGRESIRVGTTTDSYALRFGRPLSPVLRDLVVSGATAELGRGRATLLIPFAVSGAALTPGRARAGEGAVYPLAIRITVRGADGTVVVRDTVRNFSAPRVLAPGDQLNGLEVLDLAPGRYVVNIVLAQPDADAGSFVAIQDVVVPELGPAALAVSDVLVGRRADAINWVTGADSVPVSATVAYPEGSVLDVYYEVHGLPAGARYRNRIDVVRDGRAGFLGLFGGRRVPVSLAFDAGADGSPTRVRQQLNLGSLGAGRYQVRVSVEGPSGDVRHARQVILTVTSRKPA